MRRATVRLTALKAARLEVYPPARPTLHPQNPSELIAGDVSSLGYKHAVNSAKIAAMIADLIARKP